MLSLWVKEMFPRTIAMKLIFPILFMMMMSIDCTSPEDPVQCSSQNKKCTISNSYGAFADRSICHAAEVVYPTTENEIILYVGNATKMAKNMKVATRFSHSIPKLVCPQGDDGVLISTKNLNKVLKIDKSKMEITVGAGVSLRQLIEEAAKAGLALPYAPYWWGLSIGGLLSTGAHGSTLWGGSSVHDYVTRMRIVTPASPEEGYAKARTLVDGDPDLNAARVSLGVLGVISEVTIQLQPMFKRSITYAEKSDIDLGDEAVTFGRIHEFADMTWYPHQGKVVYRIDDRVSTATPANGLYDYLGFRPQAPLVVATQRTTEEVQELKGDEVGKCASAKTTTMTFKAAASGLTNNGLLFTGYPVVGFNHRLQSSGSCLDSVVEGLTTCPWDPRVGGLFFQQTAFSIGLSKVKDFIQDVQNLVTLEPSSMCNVEIYNGILMRYVTSSSAYLGEEEDSLEFDITYYRSRDPMIPRLYEDVLEEVEQMGLFKYGGLPHWGKNRNVAFEGSIIKYKNANEFLEVKKRFDPLGIFSSGWTNQILGLKNGVSIYKEGCALEGLCICSQDIHCAPSKGYFCRPGKVYKDARVCKKMH